MFSFKVSNNLVIFSKFFAKTDCDAVISAIPEETTRVVFVDTGATPMLVMTIAELTARGIQVIVRDHHRGEGRTPEAAIEIEKLLGEHVTIACRKDIPACALLVETGEFSSESTVIVADPDLDGLTAAMKAAGLAYPGLDEDAAVFDERPRQSEENLTSLGWLAVRGLSTLPPFNAANPQVSENQKGEYFSLLVKASQNDETAVSELNSRVAVYEEGVKEAKRLLAGHMTQPIKGIAVVDTIGAKRSDLNTLSQEMEATGAVVTVVRKSFGPIAQVHGTQYSVAVVSRFQNNLDLRGLVAEDMVSSPEAGMLSNTSFLLHCSEKLWKEHFLQALTSAVEKCC